MGKECYLKIIKPINSNLYSVQNKEKEWGVVDENNNVIVEFGKYEWIDGFQNGLARVFAYEEEKEGNTVFSRLKTYGSGQRGGIINEMGEEVLPTKYNVKKSYCKDFPIIKYFKGEEEHTFIFESLYPNLSEITDGDYERYDTGDYYNNYDSKDFMHDTWDAMTDGMYEDMPEGFDGNVDFLGY